MHPHDTTNEVHYGYCHCGCGQKTTIAAKTSRRDDMIKDQPMKFVHGHNWRRPLAERLWEKVKKSPDGCWLWTGAIHYSFGYGHINIDGKPHAAHRVSWELTYGPIPNTAQVLHKCDVPNCVRPDHLFLGSQADNIADMISKGRGRFNVNKVRGEKHGKSKLDANAVRAIRNLHKQGVTWQAIADQFGIARGTVGTVLAGKTWKHVE